jgi:hypothetical protein
MVVRGLMTWLVDWALRTTRIVSVNSRSYPLRCLWVELEGKSTDQNQEHLMNWNKKFEILSQFPPPLLLKEIFRPVPSKLYYVVIYKL